MLHDYLITEKFAIIPDMPLSIDPKTAIKENKFIVDFKKDEKTRYGIIPRYSTDPNSIKWFYIPKAHYIFHFSNAWDWVNDKQ